MTEGKTHGDAASALWAAKDRNDTLSTWAAAPIEPPNARDQIRKVERFIDAINDVVVDLASRPSADTDGSANSEAVEWVRRALEDVLATCTGLHISSRQDGLMRNLHSVP
ncbi:hypothetical protein V6S67_16930 [Arthrobacter sp. Soc17.1.1.1]|uniref:hypothetical protein n=1 Tax=Arthrobacter sp. Soc17.1.1.1 TaxID=3121277 RepID=UPI002FE487B5